jgi:hypothetical protein
VPPPSRRLQVGEGPTPSPREGAPAPPFLRARRGGRGRGGPTGATTVAASATRRRMPSCGPLRVPAQAPVRLAINKPRRFAVCCLKSASRDHLISDTIRWRIDGLCATPPAEPPSPRTPMPHRVHAKLHHRHERISMVPRSREHGACADGAAGGSVCAGANLRSARVCLGAAQPVSARRGPPAAR